MDDLTVTVTGTLRPWWRPLGLRALRRWYRTARREYRLGRCLSVACAFSVARLEFRIDGKEAAL